MFIPIRASWAGVVFLLLTPWISGPSPVAPPATPDQDAPAVVRSKDGNHSVNQMQQVLLDKGHYRGKVDGVFGLRTRAGIRAYQKSQHLPVTGQLDPMTADKLGVAAENGQQAAAATQAQKPSAGIRWASRSYRKNQKDGSAEVAKRFPSK
jgi:peptidoglycan hydrolase-like protein with peptidoglycan-binding domain